MQPRVAASVGVGDTQGAGSGEGEAMTDYQLATFAYAHCGIPASKWREHWRVDTTRANLSNSARTAYRAIYASVYREP